VAARIGNSAKRASAKARRHVTKGRRATRNDLSTWNGSSTFHGVTAARSAHHEESAFESPTGEIDLLELFGALARLKRSLCAEIDAQLRCEDDLSLQTFDAMAFVAERPDGSDVGDLGAALDLPYAAADALVARLTEKGLAAQRSVNGAAGPARVALTDHGASALERAGHTIEQALAGRLTPALSKTDIAVLNEVLTGMRNSVSTAKRAAARPDEISAVA
jgi:DNA-binding MarR family transcriptional regulator